jgi:hypothetical protein
MSIPPIPQQRGIVSPRAAATSIDFASISAAVTVAANAVAERTVPSTGLPVAGSIR